MTLKCKCGCDVLFEADGIAAVNACVKPETGFIFRTYDEYEGDHGINVESVEWKSIICGDCGAKNEEVEGGLKWLKEKSK